VEEGFSGIATTHEQGAIAKRAAGFTPAGGPDGGRKARRSPGIAQARYGLQTSGCSRGGRICYLTGVASDAWLAHGQPFTVQLAIRRTGVAQKQHFPAEDSASSFQSA